MPSAVVADAHNDLLLDLAAAPAEGNLFADLCLGPLRAGRVKLQVCPIFTAEAGILPELALRRALEQVLAFQRAVEGNLGAVAAVRSRADLDAVLAGERIGLMLALEGAEPLGNSPELIDIFWALGVRMAALTWNDRNPFADGILEAADGGLSRLGRRLADRIVELGMVLDLAHASPRTFDELLDRCGGRTAVCVSHAACRAVYDSERNLTNAQLARLAAQDGLLGVMALPFAIDAHAPTLDRLVDHLAHAVEVMGAERVCLGGDFPPRTPAALAMPLSDDGLPAGMERTAAIDGLAGPEGYPRLAEALSRRGFDDDTVAGILGANLLRMLRQALPEVAR